MIPLRLRRRLIAPAVTLLAAASGVTVWAASEPADRSAPAPAGPGSPQSSAAVHAVPTPSRDPVVTPATTAGAPQDPAPVLAAPGATTSTATPPARQSLSPDPAVSPAGVPLDELLQQNGPVPDGVAKQVGVFNGGIPQECPAAVEPTVSPTETPAPSVPSVAIRDRVTVPGFLTVCLPAFDLGSGVTLTLTEPAGQASTIRVAAGWDSRYGVDLFLGLGHATGTHRIRAVQGATSAEAEFIVERVAKPVIWISPEKAPAGSLIDVQLGGFPPGEPLALHLYSRVDASAIRYRATVEVPIDLTGEARLTLRTTRSTEPGKYYLHSPLMGETPGMPGFISPPSFSLQR